jgi:hypothetical protein
VAVLIVAFAVEELELGDLDSPSVLPVVDSPEVVVSLRAVPVGVAELVVLPDVVELGVVVVLGVVTVVVVPVDVVVVLGVVLVVGAPSVGALPVGVVAVVLGALGEPSAGAAAALASGE